MKMLGQVVKRGIGKRYENGLESPAKEGESPVLEIAILFLVAPKYRGTRGTLRESTGTIR
jgi:hypothetical protein